MLRHQDAPDAADAAGARDDDVLAAAAVTFASVQAPVTGCTLSFAATGLLSSGSFSSAPVTTEPDGSVPVVNFR